MLKKLALTVTALATLMPAFANVNNCQISVKYSYEFASVPSCHLGVATRDYVALPALPGLDPNLGTNMISDPQIAFAFYTPLMENKSEAVKDFVKDYFAKYLAYAPKAKYAFVIGQYNGLNQNDVDYTQLSTTALFINSDRQVSFTKNYVPELKVESNDLWLAPGKTVAVKLVDYQGVTNQSDFTILLFNHGSQAAPISRSLNVYMDTILAKAAKSGKSVISGDNISITNKNGSVVISGGTISAGSVSVSGQNVNIQNTNINAQENIDLKAGDTLDVNNSELNSPQVNAQAPKINDDGSLAKAQNKEMSQFTQPRIVGIDDYFAKVLALRGENKSRPVIDPFLAGQILGIDNSGLSPSQYVEKFVATFGQNNYLTRILPQYTQEVIKFRSK